MYDLYLMNYKKTGKKPELWKLLFVLLSEQCDKLKYNKDETKLKFYQNNNQIIDNDINKIINDFELSDDELNKVKQSESMIAVLWAYFDEAIDAITFVLVYGKNLTKDEIYEGYNISLESIPKDKKTLIFSKMRKSK